MKKTGCLLILLFIVIALFVCVLPAVSTQPSVNIAFAQVDKNFISSAEGNGIWILNKSNGELTYLQFKSKNKTFRSDSISIPSDFNLNKCQVHAFGRRGIAVLVADVYSGLIEVYKVNSDKTIESTIKFPYDKNVLLCGKFKNFWVLNKVSREMVFLQFKSEKKIKKSSPIGIPSNFNLESSDIKPVGTHGEGVFLFDASTGTTIFYKINSSDWTIKEYMNVGI